MTGKQHTVRDLEDIRDERWETEGTYRFDRNRTCSEICSIDTPSPAVSGSLYIGRVPSYIHDPSVPYELTFTPPETPLPKWQDCVAISRSNFGELCEQPTATAPSVIGAFPVRLSELGHSGSIGIETSYLLAHSMTFTRSWRRRSVTTVGVFVCLSRLALSSWASKELRTRHTLTTPLDTPAIASFSASTMPPLARRHYGK